MHLTESNMMPKVVSRRYILYFQFEAVDSTCMLSEIQRSIEETIEKAKQSSTEAFVAILGKPTVKSTSDKANPDASWVNLSEDGITAEEGEVYKLLNRKIDNAHTYVLDSTKVAEDIHGLADRLPMAGYHLDIIWPVTVETIFPVEEHIALFGALQRLKTWHNAHLTVAPLMDDRYSRTMDPWLTYLRGEVQHMDCVNLLDWDLVWRGDMRFTDGKGLATVTLPGFSLTKTQKAEPVVMVEETADEAKQDRYHDALLQYKDETKELATFEKNLDVIHIVNLADVPGCLISSDAFIVNITSGDRLPRTSDFFTWLITEGRDQNMAVLIRLAGTHAMHAALINSTGGSDAKLTTEEWKKHMYQVPNVELKGLPYALHLLVHGDMSGKCFAHVMHSPYEMNASIHVQVASSQVEFDDDDNKSLSNLEDFPVYEDNQLHGEEDHISQLQRLALKIFLDLRVSEGQGSTISVAELRELMGTVRKEYVTSTETTDRKVLKQVMHIDSTPLILTNVKTEFDQSSSEWLERLVIHHKESVEKKMKRYKSSDMMLGGMMVKKCKDNTIQLDAEEFLKHFATDGRTAVLEEALSPIGVIDGSILKSKDHIQQYNYDTLMDREQPFSELVKHKYAGVGYCLDLKKAQKLDDHFLKMQQKLVWNETASTCTMEQVASPAIMEIRTSSKSKSQTPVGCGRVKRRVKKKLSDSEKKKAMRGAKRKAEDMENSQAKKRRLLCTNTVGERFVRPTPTQTVIRKPHSLESPRTTAIRSSPRRQHLTKVASTLDSGRRRTSISLSKVTTTTIDAAARKGRSSPGRSVGSTSTRSRKQRHTEMLQSIVDELLKNKGIDKGNACYPQCSKRLFATTRDCVRALPPKSYTSLSQEMRSIASNNVEFVVMFELQLMAAKEK